VTVVLTLRDALDLEVDGSALTPTRLTGLAAAEIAAMPLVEGNRRTTVGERFTVDGDGSDELRVVGDLSRVRGLGTGMEAGRLIVEGAVGAAVGEAMTGGELIVDGDAGDWAGVAMAGGRLTIHGRAGDHLGAARPGEREGMTGGELLVSGDAGHHVGTGMRRGLIAIAGRAGDLVAERMLAGTVIALGGLGADAGSGLRRGSIVTSEPYTPPPGYAYACHFRAPALRLQLVHLARSGWPVPAPLLSARCARWSGDLLELGRGEILIFEGA
jgi:formylmethanofuran dehydrogenase subunit C